MQIEIALEKLPKGQVMGLRGRLAAMGTPAFGSAMDNLMKAGETTVLIDCSELRYVSSMALGAFVNYGKRLGAAKGTLAFASLNPHVRSVFEMVGFLKIFQVFASRARRAGESAFPRRSVDSTRKPAPRRVRRRFEQSSRAQARS